MLRAPAMPIGPDTNVDAVPPGPYLVVGCGAAGTSAARALAAHAGADAVRAWDGHDGPATRANAAVLADHGVRTTLGPWDDALLDAPTPGAVVKSPGIGGDCPPLAAALARGVPVLDELDLGRRLLRHRPLVAVTGTDGKSTTSALLAAALGGADGPVPVTGNTEFAPPITGVAPGEGPVVVECSSFQLEFCAGPFAELATFTNLTAEHLGRHGTMEAYGAVKRRLFLGGGRAVPRAVVNLDDQLGRALARELRAAGATVASFGTGAAATHRVLAARWDVARAHVRLATPTGEVELETRLPGAHNAENVAAALAGCDLLGLPREQALTAIAAFEGVPGRWQRIDAGQPFELVVDLAHTPNALRRVLLTARDAVAERPGARVHVVVGSGGGHAFDRRAPLGRLSSVLADHVVVTEGNGRGEPRERVIARILAGATGGRATIEVEPDRRLAIRRAIAGAAPGDLVVVAGRGAMPRLLTSFSGDGPPFDDRVVAYEELRRLAGDALAPA